MFADFDGTAVASLLLLFTAGVSSYVLLLLVGGGLTYPVKFAYKGIGKIERWLKGKF